MYGWAGQELSSQPWKIDALARDDQLPGCQASHAAEDHWREDCASRIGFQTQTAGMDDQIRQQESGRAGINVHPSCNKRRDFFGTYPESTPRSSKACPAALWWSALSIEAPCHGPWLIQARPVQTPCTALARRSKSARRSTSWILQAFLCSATLPSRCWDHCADGWVLDKLPACILPGRD